VPFKDWILSRASRGVPAPAMFLPLQDYAGPLALDASGNGNNGTRTGTTTTRQQKLWIPGEDAAGMGFDGSTGLLNSFPRLIATIGVKSVEVIIYPTSTSRMGIIGTRDSATAGWTIALNRTTQGNLTFIQNNVSADAVAAIPQNTWSYIAFTFDASNIPTFIYRNVAFALSANAGGVEATAKGQVGNEGGQNNFPFAGGIAMVAVTQGYVLSRPEIAMTYSAFKNGFPGANVLAA